MQAAVQAERAEAVVDEQERTIVVPRHGTTPAGNGVTPPAAKEINGKRKHAARPEAGVRPERRAKPGRTAKPQPADKATAKPPPADKAERAVKPGAATRAEAVVQPEHTAKPAAIEDENDVTEWIRPQPAGPETDPSLPAMYAHGGIVGGEPAAAPAQTKPPTRPGGAKQPGRRGFGGRLAVRLVIVVVVLAALAVAAIRHFAHPPGSGPTSAAVERQEAAARNETAVWVARQVSRDRTGTVACDRVMCAALTAHGFPSRDLLVLGPSSAVPATSAVVVETAAVKDMFGSSLATAWAPTVLASFGSGPAIITVRVIAPQGAAAYRLALNADLTQRKNAGAGLLNDSQITVPALAGAQLTGGQVDSRLLLALADLGSHQQIIIVQFGNDGPGESADVPFRFVDLAENVRTARPADAAYIKAVRAYLSTVNTKFRPATMTTVVLANGQAVLRVEFTAPSPLEMFG